MKHFFELLILPLVFISVAEGFLYKVISQTGNGEYHSTKADISATITGSYGSVMSFLKQRDTLYDFGTTHITFVKSDIYLGGIEWIQITNTHDNGWTFTMMQVLDLATGISYEFMCSQSAPCVVDGNGFPDPTIPTFIKLSVLNQFNSSSPLNNQPMANSEQNEYHSHYQQIEIGFTVHPESLTNYTVSSMIECAALSLLHEAPGLQYNEDTGECGLVSFISNSVSVFPGSGYTTYFTLTCR